MNKKKVISLLVAGVMTVGIVGGTLAWFTSSDSATNKFTTGSYSDEVTKGLDIWEKFTPSEATNLTPGADVTKKVQVKNTASYSQFIRVKITPKWTAPAGVAGTSTNLNPVFNTEKISQPTKDADGKVVAAKPEEGKWFKSSDGYYYYVGVVGAGYYTPLLLNSVQFVGTAGDQNAYVGGAFDVKVDADSIQSDHDAYLSWAAGDVKAAFSGLTAEKGDEKNSGNGTVNATVSTGESGAVFE